MDAIREAVRTKKEVIGRDVKNLQDENLGSICEVVLDKTSGKAVYAVLESGGFLGLGGKLFALPWSVLDFHKAKECFILDIDKERLSSAPGFDKDNWPDMADRTWAREVSAYYERHFTE